MKGRILHLLFLLLGVGGGTAVILRGLASGLVLNDVLTSAILYLLGLIGYLSLKECDTA